MNCKAYTQKIATLTLLILALSMCVTTGMATALAFSVASAPSTSNQLTPQTATAQVYTDKADYHPGELVTIYGSGFSANTPVAFTVTKLKDGTQTKWSADSDTVGNLTTTCQIDPEGAPLYRINATDGTNQASCTFTDSPYVFTVTDTTTGQSASIGGSLNVHWGDSLKITGSGYPTATNYYINYFSLNHLSAGTVAYPLTDTFTVNWQPTSSSVPNPFYLELKKGGDSATVYAQVTCTATAAPPTITLTQTSGNVGDTVTVTGSDFDSSQSFTVTYGSTTVASGTTTATGAIPSGTTFTVPASTSGAHTVTATQGSNSATATYTVNSKITLSPSSGNVGDTVTLTATGMLGSHSDCIATFAGSSYLTLSSSTTDSNGGLTATFTVPASTSGGKSVVFGDDTNNPAATITVTPKITLAPSSGLTGGSVAVTGTGFGSSSTVTLTYDTVTQTTTPNTVTASSSGGFSCSFTIPASTGGGHTVKATQGSNFATATYTVTTVSQPITVTMANGAPSATVTITGGNPSPSTFAADGTQHIITMDPGTSFTLSFDNSGSTTTRNGFSVGGAFSETSSSYTSSTSAVSLTAYRQYQITPYYTVSGGGSPAVTGVVHYTSNGASQTATPTLGSTGGTPFWADAGTDVTYTSPIAGNTGEQWKIDNPDVATGYHTVVSSLSMSQTITATYYHQYRYTVNYAVTGGGSPSAPVFSAPGCSDISYINNALSTSPSALWVNAGSTWSITSTLGGSTSTERWATSQTTTGTASAPATATFTYTHQYKVSFHVSGLDSAAWHSTVLTIGSNNYKYSDFPIDNLWVDSGTTFTWQNPVSGIAGTQFALNSANGLASPITGVDTGNAAYKKQYAITPYCQISGGTINVDNAVHYTSNGAPQTATPTLGDPVLGDGTPIWVDAGTAVAYTSPLGASATERWQIGQGDTTTHTVLTSAWVDQWIMATYHHQYLQTLSYQIVSGMAPSGPTVDDGTQFGSAYAPTLTTSPTGYWFDAVNSLYPNDIAGAAGERWHSEDTVESNIVNTAVFSMYHQYHLTLGYTTQDGSAIPQYELIGTFLSGGKQGGIYSLTSYGSVYAESDNWVDAGIGTVTYNTFTPTGATERWALSTSPHSFDVTGTGTITETGYYHQYTVLSFSYTTSDATTITIGSQIGTYNWFGNAHSITSTLTYGAANGEIGWDNWVDAGTATVSFTTYTTASGTEHWALTTSPHNIAVTTSGSITESYYHQYKQTLFYEVTGGGSPTVTDIVQYTSLGASQTATPTLAGSGGTAIWADSGAAISYTSPIAGASGERWQITSADSGLHSVLAAVTSSQTITAAYYHQYLQTLSYQVNGGGVPQSGPKVSEGNQFGVAYSPTLTASATGYWFDAQTDIELYTPVAGAVGEQWFVNSDVTSTTANTKIIPLYHQYNITLAYTTMDSSPISAPNVIGHFLFAGTEVLMGSTATYGQVSTQYNIHWVDAGTGTVSFSSVDEMGGTERWALSTSTHNIDVTGTGTITETGYYHQYLQTLKYQIIGGGTPTTTPSISEGYQFGASYTPTLTTTPTGYWFDYGTALETKAIAGATNERWVDDNPNVDTTTANTATISWYHQYYVTYSYLTQDGSPITSLHVIGSFTSKGHTGNLYSYTPYGSVVPTDDFHWVDAGVGTVSFNTYTAAGGAERWALSISPHSFDVTGSGTITETGYYHQYSATFGYSDSESSIITSGTQIGTYTAFGDSTNRINAGPTYQSTSPATAWVDVGTDKITYITATAGLERWALADGPLSQTVDSSRTYLTYSYYHQFKFTLNYAVNDGSSPTAPVLSYTQFGYRHPQDDPSQPQLTLTAAEYWLDAGSSWSITNPLSGATATERYFSSSTLSGTVTSSATISPTYYHQYKVTFGYSTNDGTGIDSIKLILYGAQSHLVTYTQSGTTKYLDSTSAGTLIISGTSTPLSSDWADEASAVTYLSFARQNDNTQYKIHYNDFLFRTIITSVDSTHTIANPHYYHQAYITFRTHTDDGSVPTADFGYGSGPETIYPYINFVDCGYSMLTQADPASWGDYFDIGSAYSYDSTNQMPYGATERWYNSAPPSGTVTAAIAGSIFDPLYYHQYQVTFTASYNVLSGSTGTIITVDSASKTKADLPFSAWYNSSSTLSYTYNSIAAAQTDPSRNRYLWASTSGLSQTAETTTLTVNAGGTITATYTLQTATSIDVSAPSQATAGSPFTITVTIKDQHGNTMTGYTGAVNFTSTDTPAVLPANYTFQASDAGSKTFSATLKTAGLKTITAKDTAVNTITGSAQVTVNPTTASQFTFSSTSQTTAGSPFSITITAKDAYGNIATGYIGTVHFTSTNDTAVSVNMPTDYTYTATDAGSHTFTGVILITAGPRGINVDDTVNSLSTALGINVNAAALSSIVVGVSSSSITAGPSVALSNTGYDQYGNSLGAQTVTYTVNGNTIAGVSVTRTVVGTYTVSVTTTGVTITTASFTVNAGPLASIAVQVSQPSVVAGSSVSFYAQGYDLYGNNLGPQSGVFVVNGTTVGGTSVIETLVGDYVVSIASGSVTVRSANFHVNAGPLAMVTIEVSSSNVTAGTPVSLSATGFDQYRNSLGPQAVTFTVNGSPIQGATVTEVNVGDYSVSITASGLTVTTAIFHVYDAGIDHLVLASGSNSITAGGTAEYTVNAVDQYGNTWDVTNQASYSINCPSTDCGWVDNTVTVTKAGTWTVTVSYSGVSVTSQFTVSHAATDSISLTASASTAVGSTVTVTATASDVYGNSWDVTADTTWSIDSAAGGTWIGNVYTAAKVGSWTITGKFASSAATVSLTVNAAALDHFDVATSTTATKTNTAFNVTVTAKDAYGNTITNFNGVAALSASIGAVTPGTFTFSGGAWIGSVTLSTVGAVTITAADSSGHRGTSSTITTTPDSYTITVRSDYGSPTQSATVKAGNSFIAQVTSPVSVGSNIRMVCVGYSTDGGAIQSGNSYTFTNVQADHSISFVWAKQYQVTVTASEGGSVSPNGDNWANEGALSIHATAQSNYTFNAWNSSGSVQFDDSTLSTTNALVTGPCTIIANFVPTGAAPSNGTSDQTTTIIATQTDNQQTYNVNLNGNITASQMSNMTITPYVANSSTVVAFTVTGPSGTTGFANITLSKSAIPYGTNPVIYIDGVAAENQGYTEDANNFYLWYTTHFSTHQITVQFKTNVPEPTAESPWLYYVLIAMALVVVLFVILFAAKRRKKDDKVNKTSNL